MKIFPLQGSVNQPKPSFKGYYKYLTGSYSNEKLSDEKQANDYPIEWDCSGFLKQAAPGNASVQRTVGDFHTVHTNKVYFADPMEYVTNYKRMQADYVVYDNEPPYPDVNKEVSLSYFGQDETNYAKKFTDIRDYYNRLENADRRAAEENRRKILAGFDIDKSKEKLDFYNSRIQSSQYQQWQAEECLNLYNKGYDLRMLKGKNESEIRTLEQRIENYESQIEYNNMVIRNTQNTISIQEKTIDLIKTRLGLYQQLEELPKSITNIHNLKWNHEKDSSAYLNLELKSDESTLIKERAPQMESFIERYKKGIEELKDEIKKYQKELERLPGLIVSTKAELCQKEKLLADTKAKLMPIFDELKHFYAKQRILH